MEQYKKILNDVSDALEDSHQAMILFKRAMSGTDKQARASSDEFKRLATMLNKTEDELNDFLDGLKDSKAWKEFQKEANKSSSELERFGEKLSKVSKLLGGFVAASKGPTTALKGMNALYGDSRKQVLEFNNSIRLANKALISGSRGFTTASSASRAFNDSLNEISANAKLSREEATKLFSSVVRGYEGMKDKGALNNLKDMTIAAANLGMSFEEASKHAQNMLGIMNKYKEFQKGVGTAAGIGAFVTETVSGGLGFEQQESILQMSRAGFGGGKGVGPSPEEATVARLRNTEIQQQNTMLALNQEIINSAPYAVYEKTNSLINEYAMEHKQGIALLDAFGTGLQGVTALLGGLAVGITGFGGAARGLGILKGGGKAASTAATNALALPNLAAADAALAGGAKGAPAAPSAARSAGRMGRFGAAAGRGLGAAGRGLGMAGRGLALGLGPVGLGLLIGGGVVAAGHAWEGRKQRKAEEGIASGTMIADVGEKLSGMSSVKGDIPEYENLKKEYLKYARIISRGDDKKAVENAKKELAKLANEVDEASSKAQALSENLKKANDPTSKLEAWAATFRQSMIDISLSVKQAQERMQAFSSAASSATIFKDSVFQAQMLNEEIKDMEISLDKVQTEIKGYETGLKEAREAAEQETDTKKREEALKRISEFERNINAARAKETEALTKIEERRMMSVLADEKRAIDLADTRFDQMKAQKDMNETLRLGIGVQVQDLQNLLIAGQERLDQQRQYIAQINELAQRETNIINDKNSTTEEIERSEARLLYYRQESTKATSDLTRMQTELLNETKAFRESYISAIGETVAGMGAVAKLIPKQGFGTQYFAPSAKLGGQYATRKEAIGASVSIAARQTPWGFQAAPREELIKAGEDRLYGTKAMPQLSQISTVFAGGTDTFNMAAGKIETSAVKFERGAEAISQLRIPTEIQKFNKGGFAQGVGNKDTVPARLTPGEYVVPKKDAQAMAAIHKNIQHFANGGMVKPAKMDLGSFVQAAGSTMLSHGPTAKREMSNLGGPAEYIHRKSKVMNLPQISVNEMRARDKAAAKKRAFDDPALQIALSRVTGNEGGFSEYMGRISSAKKSLILKRYGKTEEVQRYAQKAVTLMKMMSGDFAPAGGASSPIASGPNPVTTGGKFQDFLFHAAGELKERGERKARIDREIFPQMEKYGFGPQRIGGKMYFVKEGPSKSRLPESLKRISMIPIEQAKKMFGGQISPDPMALLGKAIRGYQLGGNITSDQMAYVHAGEKVLNKEETKAYNESVASGMSKGGGGGISGDVSLTITVQTPDGKSQTQNVMLSQLRTKSTASKLLYTVG